MIPKKNALSSVIYDDVDDDDDDGVRKWYASADQHSSNRRLWNPPPTRTRELTVTQPHPLRLPIIFNPLDRYLHLAAEAGAVDWHLFGVAGFLVIHATVTATTGV